LASDTHVATVELDDDWFLAAGLSLPGLGAPVTDSAAHAPPIHEISLDVLRRACRRAACDVVLRAAAEAETVAWSLFVCRHGRVDDVTMLAELADSLARRLDFFSAVAMDRDDLERVVAIDRAWEGVRLVKRGSTYCDRDVEVLLFSDVNRKSSGWRGLAEADRFVLDLGLFPISSRSLDPAALYSEASSARTKSKVLAEYNRHDREALLANLASAQRLLDEQLFVGTAVTLFAPQAVELADELRPFHGPLHGAVAGETAFTTAPHEFDERSLGLFALDYSEERGESFALEADVGAFSSLPAWLALGRAKRRHDPWQLLLARIEASEQQSGISLAELRDAVVSARQNLLNGLSQARRLLETIVGQQYKKCLPNGRKEILCDRIEELREKGKIPSLVASHMHTVRVHGNIGSHVTDQQASLEHLFLVVDALCLLIPWQQKQP
jgi:hypothetical protein